MSDSSVSDAESDVDLSALPAHEPLPIPRVSATAKRSPVVTVQNFHLDLVTAPKMRIAGSPLGAVRQLSRKNGNTVDLIPLSKLYNRN